MSDSQLQDALRLHQQGNLAEAARLYGAVLQANPRHFQALYLLGFVHFQWDKFEDAERLIGEAIGLNPNVPDAHYNRGCALQKLKRDEEAKSCFESALALKPDYVEAEFNRGTSLLKLLRYDEALLSFNAALRFLPGDAEAWFNRGIALQNLRRYVEARASHERALQLNPNLAFAAGKLIYCKLQCCDWDGLAEASARIEDAVRAGRPVIGPLEHMLISDSPAALLQSARLWVTREFPPASSSLWRGERYGHERIRIAYLSPDFRGHAVAYQLAGIVERHDRLRFESFALSHGPDDGSAVRQRLKAGFEHFIDLRGRSDHEAAVWLRQNEIDIAIDLAGHTMDSRLSILAQRPAPLQVAYLGFPGTTGAPYIDYVLADRIVIPEQDHVHFSEKIVTLPDSFFPTDAARAITARAPSRAEIGLPDGAFVFCSFNAVCKISPRSFAIWMRLLGQVENSVLWLPDQSEEARGNLQRAAKARGVAPDRIHFAPYTARADDHLARLPLADLFLDSMPYNAHATASDALWMGLPVLTCTGGSFAGRVAASLLHAIGLPELIAGSEAAYEASALHLARDTEALAEIRARLSRNRAAAPLFDTARYVSHLEAAYAEMWRRWQRGEAPAHFAIAAKL